VQWCGLVYADALLRLARHVSDGPWRQLAEGIVRSGIQQTYPASDPKYLGLLPDSFNLRTQTRNPANINPATLLAPAIGALGQPPLYEFRAFHRQGLGVHAPGELRDLEERADGLAFTVAGWSPRPYFVLITGLRQTPQVRLNERTVLLNAPHEYQAAAGRLILQVSGTARIEVGHPALAALQIRRVPGVAEVQVRWPAAAGAYNFVLESTSSLGGGAPWEEWMEAVQPTGDQLMVHLTPREPQGWFRLRR